MGGMARLFDHRDAWFRFLLLDLSGLGYLLLGHGIDVFPTPGQWLLAIMAFVAGPALARWPPVGLLVQVVLLAVAFPMLDDPTINQVGASWAFAEVVLWAARPRWAWLGGGLLLAVYLVFDVARSPAPLLASIYGLIAPIGIPLLLGLAVRASRELTRQAEQRAVAEQLRSESESRAARSDERAAIARELHDVVAHHVASMVLRAGVARHVLTDADPRVTEVLDDVHGTGTTALAELRRIVELLREADTTDAALTAIDPGALPTALGVAVDNARRTGLIVDADIDDAIGTIDAVRGLAVLRLTQEALTNVAKHAGTSARARLRVAVVDGRVAWEVADDGGGTTPAPLGGGGHGLVGMRERVEVLGGELTAGPDGTGWLVRTELPVGSTA
jgi:signal transduction histidine kinase